MIKDTIFYCGERNNKTTTNRMADVAGIFGLKFGEKFKLKEYGHIVEVPNYDGTWDEPVFFFSDDGIEYDSIYYFDVDDEDNVQLLFDIIVGKYEIVKQSEELMI